MYKALVETTLAIPRKKVFEALVAFGGLEKVLPDTIRSVEVTGNGIGAERTIRLKDGGTVVERLDVAHDDTIFGYTIIFNDALPIKNYCAVVILKDTGSGTIVRWGSNWDAADGSTDVEVKKLLEGLYSALLDRMHLLV